jgi:hypothetical protein
VGSPQFIYALGVISANYNALEFQFRQLFELYSGMPTPAGLKVFMDSTNDRRQILLKMCAKASIHPLRVKNRVDHFADGYSVCAQNRNILMHSEPVPLILATGEAAVHFKKYSNRPPFRENIYAPSVKAMRKVADAMYIFRIYGRDLFFHVLQNFERDWLANHFTGALPPYELPRKPPLPAILSPVPQ